VMSMRPRYFPGAVASGLVVAVCLSGIGCAADTLPTYCGGVGAKSYSPPAVTIPPVVLNRGTVITVTNATVAVNGDTSSVKTLVANPGPDGISIQEAIMATNNDRGTWVIQFAPALKGSTIVVDPGGKGALDSLTGGNVTINGDIDADGQPDITLTSTSGTSAGFFVASGGNVLNGLALQTLTYGVFIGSGQPVASGKTFSNITISNLVLTNIQNTGIFFCPECGSASLLFTGNTWDHVLITGNTLTGSDSGPVKGIVLQFGSTVGDTLQHTTIANNNMVGAGGIGMGVGGGIGWRNNRALDTLIVNNSITSSHRGIGIGLGGNFSNLQFTGNGDPAGGDGGSGNLIDGMQIVGNQIRGPGGIGLSLGDTPSDGFQLPVIQFAENNIARNIGILANTIEGGGIAGYAGSGTVRNDTISNLSILGNTITGVRWGVSLSSASSFGSPAISTGNVLSNVLVQANTILVPGDFTGGIGATVGWRAQGNSINGISITNNDVDTTAVGINIVAGSGTGAPYSGPPFPADNNVVSAAQIFCNQVGQTPRAQSGIKGINVIAGQEDAHGNQVQQLYLKDNLVAGVLGDASLFPNLGDGASGNTISMSGPVDGPQFTNAGLLSAATLQHRASAPCFNTTRDLAHSPGMKSRRSRG